MVRKGHHGWSEAQRFSVPVVKGVGEGDGLVTYIYLVVYILCNLYRCFGKKGGVRFDVFLLFMLFSMLLNILLRVKEFLKTKQPEIQRNIEELSGKS